MTAVHNITIDDADTTGAIRFTNSRDSVWADQACTSCYAKPVDLTQVYDGTWRDTTHIESDSGGLAAQFLFTGTDIYIFGIQVNGTSGIPIVNNDLTFTLDGQPAGTYTHTPGPNDVDYRYHVPFFTGHNLTQGPHNLTMELTGTSMVLFDYLVYTTSETSSQAPSSSKPTGANPNPSSSGSETSSNHVGAIAGGVIGGFTGLVILIILIWSLFFRTQKHGNNKIPEPFNPVSKMEDFIAGSQRPVMGTLARLHGPINGTIEPLTFQEREEREQGQAFYYTNVKRGMTQGWEGVRAPVGLGGGEFSRNEVTTSIEQQLPLGPSPTAASPSQPTLLKSPIYSQSVPTILPVYSAGGGISHGGFSPIRGSAGGPVPPASTEYREAPPAYGANDLTPPNPHSVTR